MNTIRLEDAGKVAKALRDCPRNAVCEKCESYAFCTTLPDTAAIPEFYAADLLDALAARNTELEAELAEVTRERDATINAMNAACGINIFMSNAFNNKRWADETEMFKSLIAKANDAFAILRGVCAGNGGAEND